MKTNRIAYYCDLGINDYFEIYTLQEQIASTLAQKKELPDIILLSEHYKIINFGMRKQHNSFSQELYDILEQKKIEPNLENIKTYLKQEHNIAFCQSSRGGGATYIGPGQLNIYPITKFEEIVGTFKLEKYTDLIDNIMLHILHKYQIPARNVSVAKEMNEEFDPRDRKDIWVDYNNTQYKLGGKGICFSKGIAYHGFNFYVTKESTNGFKFVNACGYPSSELDVISVEQATKQKINNAQFKQDVLSEIQKQFNYTKIQPISKQELHELYKKI